MKNISLIDRRYVNNTIRERKADIHKGDCGRILVIAGSNGMAGAAILCARGALRTGAGLVQVAIDEKLYPVIHSGVVEATCRNRDIVSSDLRRYDAIAIGPGIGDDVDIRNLISLLLSEYSGTLVMDADALNIVASDNMLQKVRCANSNVIITPHIGEAMRLTGRAVTDANRFKERDERVKLASELADLTRAIVLLKGAGTIVTSVEYEAYINTTGNPGMATGGSGDVLTGIIASIAGQGYEALEATAIAAYVHGLAGDIAQERFGQWGLVASDIAQMSAIALHEIMKDR